MAIVTKRIYESASPRDGYRVLVDRLWPRGISRAQAAVHLWLREVAPSTALRVWFNHDPARWPEFRSRYQAELREHRRALTPLVARARKGRLTLLYSARDERRNQAVALRSFLMARHRVRKTAARRLTD